MVVKTDREEIKQQAPHPAAAGMNFGVVLWLHSQSKRRKGS